MKNKFDSVAKNLFADFLVKQFKSSREFRLRLSLISKDVRKELLIKDDFSVVFENVYFAELLQEFGSELSKLDSREIIFHDIHNFQLFLSESDNVGFTIFPAGDYERLFLDTDLAYPMSAYMVEYSPNINMTEFVDRLYVGSGDDFGFFGLLMFLLNHLEFIA